MSIYDCNAERARYELTRDMAHAIGQELTFGPKAGSQEEMLTYFEYLRGVVAEYTDGGGRDGRRLLM